MVEQGIQTFGLRIIDPRVLALTTLADPWTGGLASSNLHLVLDTSRALVLAFAAPRTAERGKREFLHREMIGAA